MYTSVLSGQFIRKTKKKTKKTLMWDDVKVLLISLAQHCKILNKNKIKYGANYMTEKHVIILFSISICFDLRY